LLVGFDPRSNQVGFVVNKVALGQVFSEFFGFPCQFPFRQMLHTHLSSGASTIGQFVANVLSRLSLTLQKKKQPYQSLVGCGGLDQALVNDKPWTGEQKG
jgi:hypothetical protein